MIGNFLVNHDVRKVAYQFTTPIQFIGEFILTRMHLRNAEQLMDKSKSELLQFTTNQLSGLKLEELSFDELPDVIKKVEILLEDLKELKAKTEETPPHEPIPPKNPGEKMTRVSTGVEIPKSNE